MLGISVSSYAQSVPNLEKVTHKERIDAIKGSSSLASSSKKLNELRLENNSLKEQQQVLIDYARQLRLKYKDLQKHCLDDAKGKKSHTQTHAQTHTQTLGQCEKRDDVIPLSQYKDLQRKFQELQSAASNSTFDSQTLARQLSESNDKNTSLENKYESLKKEFDAYRQDKESVHASLQAKINELQSETSTKKKEASYCDEQLESSQKLASRVPALEKELLGLKNELLLRKSAAEVLGTEPVKPSPVPARNVSVGNVSAASVPSRPSETVLASDVTIVEVTGNKVSLRVGPGTQHSPVMDLQKGTKLTVEAKEKDWYRVFSPTGGRAFIHSKYVKVVSGNQNPSQSSQPRGRLEVEPRKPDIPLKPVRRVGSSGEKDSDEGGVEIPLGEGYSEALAIEKLMEAMKSGLQEKSVVE